MPERLSRRAVLRATLRAIAASAGLGGLAGCGQATLAGPAQPSPTLGIPPGLSAASATPYEVNAPLISSGQPTVTAGAPPGATPTGRPAATPTGRPSATPTATPTPAPVRFAVIGDFGWAGSVARDVSELVAALGPEFIVTAGDNNYPDGAAETIDRNIGQYYQQFIHPYQGGYGPGASENRFWPCLGNHDWQGGTIQPYLDYFALPGNERYYSLARGPVRFLMLDSDPHEPDGVTADSAQAAWLRDELARAAEPWKIVVFHHAPYTSSERGPSEWMRWPFREWGASLVIAGHDHFYERFAIDGLPYIVNGLGGAPRYALGERAPGSQVFYNLDYGAMIVEASVQRIELRFITIREYEADRFVLAR